MSRSLGGVIVFAALLLSFNYLPPQWLEGSLMPINPFGERVSLANELSKTQRLQRQIERVAARIVAKEEAATRFLADELTLVELAAEFRALHEGRELSPDPCALFGTIDPDEAWCRLAMNWVVIKVRIAQSPEQARALEERIEEELMDHMQAHDGRVELPD
jgi:hypothetical protein